MFNLQFARLFLGEASLSTSEGGRQMVVWNEGSILERRAFIENGVCIGAEILDVDGNWKTEGAGHLVENLNQCLVLLASLGMEINELVGKGLGEMADQTVAFLTFLAA